MSLQSRCNYSVVAARVLWEGEERGRGKEEGGGGVMGRVVGRDVTRCACKKKEEGCGRGRGGADCAEWQSKRRMEGASQLEG